MHVNRLPQTWPSDRRWTIWAGLDWYNGDRHRGFSSRYVWYECKHVASFDDTDAYLTQSYHVQVDQPVGDNPLCIRGNICIIGRHSSLRCMDWSAQVLCFIYVVLATSLIHLTVNRLAQIRKVGLSSNHNRRPTRKPWLPLPLRRRSSDLWSWMYTTFQNPN